ncbi:MAG: methyltransferase domain-containing protein [Chloroflexi bacterium]|nr:methyltransferase domain-containing protein [Chloroflexota bacterium]
MSCPQCQGIDAFLDAREAKCDLARYRKKGPDKTTRMLLDAVKAESVEGRSLLDIGGGVGAIQHELIAAGLASAVSVDASEAHLEVARQEAERRGHAERIQQRFGDFVDLAPEVEAADIVTLDRVICCYHDVESLVGLSSARAKSVYAVVYPRDNWLFRLLVRPVNTLLWVIRARGRNFVHPTSVVEALVEGNGLRRTFYRKSGSWQVAVFTRV